MGTEIIQMKISLDDIKPEIWRRFTIDSSSSLADLHITLQVVMGWENYHLYGFYIDDAKYGPEEDESDPEDANKTTLKSLKLKTKQEFRYVYDFGDDWQHTILIEKIEKSENASELPLCLEGARCCPPEDCGSIPGYENLIKAMQKPKSSEAKDLIEWLGKIYDPEEFDLALINSILQPGKKTKTKAKKAGV